MKQLTTLANGYFINDNTQYVNLDVTELSPNRIGIVTELYTMQTNGKKVTGANIQFRDLNFGVIVTVAEAPEFSTFEINKVIRRRSIKAIMKGFNFSCTQAANFFRYHAVDKAMAEHLHMSRQECLNYDFDNLFLN